MRPGGAIATIAGSELDTRLLERLPRHTERVLTNAAVVRILETERTRSTQLEFAHIIKAVSGVYPRVMLGGDMDAGAWSCGMVTGLIHGTPLVRELNHRALRDAQALVDERRSQFVA